jgi:hypothetical protein
LICNGRASTSSSIQVEGNDSGMDQPMNLWSVEQTKEFIEQPERICGITPNLMIGFMEIDSIITVFHTS